MPHPTPDFANILTELARRKVEFIIVGGVGAALQGAPITTMDLDLVHSRELGNVTRLTEALQALGAFYREQPSKRLSPQARDLSGPGHHLLMTDAGPLDLLGTVVGDRAFEDLLPHAVELKVAEGVRVRVLDLPTLIAHKEELGRDKDRATLPILRKTLEER